MSPPPGRPGPVLIDLPKDVQFADGDYTPPAKAKVSHYQPRQKASIEEVNDIVALIEKAERPVFYTGGGVINSGPGASQLLRELVDATGFPITSTLMGLGAYPASGKGWLGMLGMHGLYEANMAMHDCDLMINIGARFDDRITGRVQDFSPNSFKVHIDIDPSSVNKIVRVDLPVIGDVGHVLEDVLKVWKSRGRRKQDLSAWWDQIDTWKEVRCPHLQEFRHGDQTAICAATSGSTDQRHGSLCDHRGRPAPNVGRHSSWALRTPTAG